MKKITLFIVCSLIISSICYAGEGMWLPILLKQYNEKDMQNQGLKLSAEDIYDINHSSIKDAVIVLNDGMCTAEIVSDQGLLFTNHHCGYESIAEHSTVEHDYLKNGFWAKNHGEELPNQGMTAARLVYMKDVTSIILDEANKIKNEDVRAIRIKVLRDSLEKAEPNPNNYKIQINSFFYGNEFYLLAYEVFPDVRLVGAPPSAIGKFGGDQDNWMWPRHTGDFSILRIYTDKDGKPAKFSKDNIPYKPKYFLPISLKGVKKDDYTMILGYPGNTQRYLTSDEFEYNCKVHNPAVIEAMALQINIMKQDMDADRAVALTMAGDFASTSNSYKYMLGQERQLKQNTYILQQKEKEAKFMEWVNADESRKLKYGKIFDKIRDANEKLKTIEPAYSYVAYGFFGIKNIQYGLMFYGLHKNLENDKLSRQDIDSLVAPYKNKVKSYYEKNTVSTDKKVLASEIYLICSRVPEEKQPSILIKALSKYKKNDLKLAVDNYVNDLYANSPLLQSEANCHKFLGKISMKKLEKDPFFKLVSGMINYYFATLSVVESNVTQIRRENTRLYIQGLREWQSDKKFYPDANSTLRVTYGKVSPYIPRDAVSFKYYTTYQGILEKYNPQDPEFDVPSRQLDLLRNKQFGRYAENDTLRIDFLTTTDITGGNSGSPVMDAQGKLIGLAFDGDWESMIGDLVVDPKVNRTIAVDIRYVLWVIDIYAGAQNIMSELKIE